MPMSRNLDFPQLEVENNVHGIQICNNADVLVKYCEQNFHMSNVDIARESGTSVVTIKRYKQNGRSKIEAANRLYQYMKQRLELEISGISVKDKMIEIEKKLENALADIRALISTQQ